MIVKTVVRPETEMKDSSIEYLGKIPTTWEKCRLKNVCTSFNSNITTSIINKEHGNYKIFGASGLIGYIEFETMQDEYLGIVKDGAGVGRIGSYPSHSSLLGTLAYIIPNDGINMKWLKYVIENMNLGESIDKTTIPHIYFSTYGNNYIPFPSSDEQQAIADYLDETCFKIDEIIAEAKASIDEYKELKQAVIFDGISLGTKSCCEYKKTTLEGIKKIPVAWEYRKLKFLIKYIESGVSVNAGNEPATELEYGVLKTSCVSKMFFIPSENKSVNKDEYARVKCPVCGNTIIVSRMNTPDLVGACAYIEKNINNIFLPDRLWQVHFNDDVNVKYVYYCLISPYIRNYYSSLSTGTSSSMQNISQGQFANAIIPYPSLEEQKEIVEFLDKRTAEIDSLIAEKESLINDLEAYKKSLIYEVVTGKRKVV